MTMKILPREIRSMLSASAQINNYLRAVEELVYNALDAESTSIATRINIQENRIQVVDNGNGILKNDFDALGQRYMTSKLPDNTSLYSTPIYYGYRGEFLANIIELSQNVIIASRHKDGEDTLAKTFYNGRNTKLTKITSRPSKGTTIDIKGFLYNRNIRKHVINPISDVQNIKSFLEQLSVVRNNISLSLRDDSKNEIIFQIHKKRDIYQTLSVLFHIEKSDVQELQVEKNPYKIKALIGKTDVKTEKRWVYLNGKFIINNSKLHNTINKCMKKYNLVTKENKKVKHKINHDEYHLRNKDGIFYFVFITCPLLDYYTQTTIKQTVVEFKDWDRLKIIIEKLVKFYFNDIGLKKNNCKTSTAAINQKQKHSNLNQIKEIIDKILGNNTKTLGALQVQNGIEGKLIKRIIKNKEKGINKRKRTKIFLKKCKNSQKNNTTSNNIAELQEEECLNINQDKNIIDKLDIRKEIVENEIGESHPIEPKIVKKYLKTEKKNMKNRNENNNIRNIKISHINKNEKRRVLVHEKNKVKYSKHKDSLGSFQYSKKTKSHPKETILEVKSPSCLNQNTIITENKVVNNIGNAMNGFKRPRYSENFRSYNLKDKVKIKSFKTTYDLVQPILEIPEEIRKYQDIGRHDCKYIHSASSRKTKSMSYNVGSSIKIRSQYKHSEIDIYSKKEEEMDCRQTPRNIVDYDFGSENSYKFYKSHLTDINSLTESLVNTKYKRHIAKHSDLILEDIFKENSNAYCKQNAYSGYLSTSSTVSALTYESHNYNTNQLIDLKANKIYQNAYTNKIRNKRFITKESRDNFTYSHNYPIRLFENNLQHRKKEGYHKRYLGCLNQDVDESYTIQFTTSNKSRSSYSSIYLGQKTHYIHKNIFNYEPFSGFGITYTASNRSSPNSHINKYYHTKYINSNELFTNNSVTERNYSNNRDPSKEYKNQDKKIITSTYLPITQYNNNEAVSYEVIEPLNICKTVYQEHESEKEFTLDGDNRNRENCDTLCNNSNMVAPERSKYCSVKYMTQNIEHTNINSGDVSHHFSNILTEKISKTILVSETNLDKLIKTDMNQNNECDIQNLQDGKGGCDMSSNNNNFDIKNRLRFVPKGMSQIFEICGSKIACDYNLEKDYYQNVIYSEFANDIQIQTEIYEPGIQNVEDFTTKDINKFKNKIHKDTTSLTFNETSLKEAQVLNQVDCKFIAATIKEKSEDSEIASKYLVLFDQHAVHERIRLEKNLTEYYKEDKWISVAVDNIVLKMSRDEIIYLHNYKDKFSLLGLQWIISNKDEVLINSIPKAILGKNHREVEKVMNAVKNLIMEEINIIKLQKGCISMYPKSIMDLVYSEACRYAIKFGDKLSKNECSQLLNELSTCKTPFQCAHGRPVMAVIIEVRSDVCDYKINRARVLHRFKSNK